MNELTDFLLARIAEDEEMAGSGWGRPVPGRWCRSDEGRSILTPQAILAECESKRRIVMEFEQVHADYRIAPTPMMEGQRFGLAKAVAALAEVYTDHPDYQEDWKP